MGKPRRSSTAAAAVFSASQIEQMEQLVADKKKSGDGLPDADFCHQLATKFNRSPSSSSSSSSSSGGGGGGGSPIQADQIQQWFHNKLTGEKTEPNPHVPSDINLSDNLRPPSSDAPQDADRKDKMPELDEIEFEARSSRDYAWYDVGVFLAHRITNGQVEVKVRYADFGADEDEWINVKKAIRVRSIPVESSECKGLRVGDLVLCFREGSSEAVHYDAHIIGIERKLHDVRGCRCLFLIKYDHDETEEKVPLSKLCRRPKF